MLLRNKKLNITGQLVWRDPWVSDTVAVEDENGKVHELSMADCEEVTSWRRKIYFAKTHLNTLIRRMKA